MPLRLVPTTKFKKDLKKIKKRGYNLEELQLVLNKLCAEESLDDKYRDHALVGIYTGFRECHIRPDWLLIYAIEKDKLILTAAGTGSHSDLFKQ